jgi:polynucleotide 5'-hydroxyl-kinase GRC3/NOL9
VAALDRAAALPVTVVLGASDTGKTSLATWLAARLAEALPTAVVDADLGQSEIGPPTTIGLGRARPALRRLGEADLVAMHFVGTTSPVAAFRATFDGVRALVARARHAGFARVIVDTPGLVAGRLGRVLADGEIAAADADLVVALERGEECAHLLAPYAGRARPAIVRLPALEGHAPRRQAARRAHRRRALDAYLRDARPVALDLARVRFTPPAHGRTVPGTIVGLCDAAGETVAIGVVREVDEAARRLVVETPAAPARVAAVAAGRERR